MQHDRWHCPGTALAVPWLCAAAVGFDSSHSSPELIARQQLNLWAAVSRAGSKSRPPTAAAHRRHGDTTLARPSHTTAVAFDRALWQPDVSAVTAGAAPRTGETTVVPGATVSGATLGHGHVPGGRRRSSLRRPHSAPLRQSSVRGQETYPSSAQKATVGLHGSRLGDISAHQRPPSAPAHRRTGAPKAAPALAAAVPGAAVIVGPPLPSSSRSRPSSALPRQAVRRTRISEVRTTSEWPCSARSC